MSRTPEDLKRMMMEDSDIGLNYAHYKPMEAFIKERGYKRGLEIGCAYGGLSNHLLSTCELDLLLTVDPYLFYPDMPGLFDQEDYDNLREQTYKRLIVHKPWNAIIEDSKKAYEIILEGWTAIGKSIRDFDWIFIDGLHKYETIKWECENYQSLVKPGGALMGHDYNLFEDVNKAVDEFAKRKELFTLPGDIWYLNY